MTLQQLITGACSMAEANSSGLIGSSLYTSGSEGVLSSLCPNVH